MHYPVNYRPLRQHEIERIEREVEAADAADRKRFWHNVMVVKATIAVTFILYMLVPDTWKDWVALGGNMLWLWRT